MGPRTQASARYASGNPASRRQSGTRVAKSGADTKDPGVTGIRTLIVEDSDVDRRVLLTAATQLGLRAEAVDSGQEAIQRLMGADGDDGFDLLLMDFKMPDLDGLTASKYIKNELRLEHRPRIVLLSAYKKEEIFEADCDPFCIEGFLTKPVGSSGLAEMIDDLQEAARLSGETWPDQRRDSDLLAASHVLLAEDNLINQKVAAGILTRKDVQVTVAQHGQEAIDKVLDGRPGAYDAILMDVDMPHVDGYEATRRIKSQPDYAHIPIIAVTAHNSREDREHCLAVGMSAYLSKPIQPDLLYETLLSFLRRP